MKRHKRLYTRLFLKTYRHRANPRHEYLRNRKKTSAKHAGRALRAAKELREGPLALPQATNWESLEGGSA